MIPPLFFELVVRCGSLVRHASRRIPMLEKILRITLSDEDYSALLAACSDGNIRVGEFYQWKIRQMGMVDICNGSRLAVRARACRNGINQAILNSMT